LKCFLVDDSPLLLVSPRVVFKSGLCGHFLSRAVRE
jgi:hypothetical protein